MKLNFKYQKLIYPGLLVAIVATLAIVNYVPGMYLSGWDTLHPEFDFALNFKRLIFGVFRSDQGLGAVAAQSHMADLPRVVLLFLTSILIPQYFLRYFFIIAYLLTGVLGVYFFIERVLLQHSGIRQKAAFLGALFYLFNLGTLQHFVVVLEMFAVEYAMLPWLFLTALEYLRLNSRRHLIGFAIVALLAAPMAHTATLWYVFFISFASYLSFSLVKNWRKVLILVSVLLVVNSFWILPNLYFLISADAASVSQAKVNKIFSQEAFLHNQNRGNFFDLIIFKNFLFDWLIYNGPESDTYDYLLSSFRKYLEQKWVMVIGYGGAAFVLLGIIISWMKGPLFVKALILPTILAIVFLTNNNPPFKPLFSFLQSYIPLFDEAFRLVFTKFSIILMFTFACYFAIGVGLLLSLLSRLRNLSHLATILIASLLVLYAWPFFKGELISRYIQVKIPSEYFEVFNWFDTQPDGRIVQLPVYSFWNWSYYSWGFQGAYFLPFGIKQPLMDRDFDRWNLSNEQAFREISYAVYSQDLNLLENALKKYQIAYLLFDKNVLAPGRSQDKKALFYLEIESMLASAGDKIKLVKNFGNISVYQVEDRAEPIRAASTYTKVSTSGKGAEVDWVFREFGDYIATDKNPAFTYPFYSLSDNQNFLLEGFDQLTQFSPSQEFPAVDYLSKESYIPVDLYAAWQDNNLILRLNPKVTSEQFLEYFYPIPETALNQRWLLNLDNNQTIVLNNARPDFSYQGKLFLSTQTTNSLSLYQDEPGKLQDNITFLTQPGICPSPLNNKNASLSTLVDGLKISAKNISVCIRLPLVSFEGLDNLELARNLLKISFLVEPSNGEIKGHYCLFSKILQRCVKENKDLDAGEVVDYLLVDPLDIDKWDLVLFADNVDNLKEREVVYRQLKVSATRPTVVWTLTTQALNQLLTGQTINYKAGSDINLLADLSTDNAQLFEGGHPKANCGGAVPKKFDRISDQTKGYIEYSAVDGSTCDYFAFPNLPHNLGYLLTLESQNLSGLPLRVCIANSYSKRCDIFSALPKNMQFNQDTLMIPPIGDGGTGYNLHFNNYSIGNIPTVNRIRSMKLTPLPYYWLTRLQLKSPDSKPAEDSKMQVQGFRQILPQLYVVELKNSGTTPGLLVLDQSFDPGWRASSGEHVLVNNWANGWLIKGDGSKRVYIFFWPQLLEFAGFGLGITTFVWLLLTKGRKYD